jgi:hypothetical protein
VPVNHKKNNTATSTGAILLVVAFLFLSFSSAAQEEDTNGTIDLDTTVLTIPPAEEVDMEVGLNGQPPFTERQDSLVVLQRNVPGDVVKKIKADEDFWYADSVISAMRPGKPPGTDKEKDKKNQAEDPYVPLGQRSWFQTLLWIVIIGAFAIGLAIYLSGSRVGLFRKKNPLTALPGEEEFTEDIFAINYLREIDKAAAKGNYRLAVRLLYLQLLKNLSEKNIIRYKQDKTNLDYLLELHPTPYYRNFFKVTRDYEYSWYGQFPVSEDAYRLIRSDFDRFDQETK